MTIETYRLIHIVGVLCLFLGLGGLLAGDGKRGFFMALHGIGLIAMVVAGVGFLHKAGLGWPNWAFAKIGCWLVLALLPTIVKRNLLSRQVAILLVLAIGATAAWLAEAKPF